MIKMVATYRFYLDGAQTTLTAATLTGAGALAVPGLAAKAALQSLLTLLNSVDETITRSWNPQVVEDRLASDGSQWATAHAGEFATAERLASKQLDYIAVRRDEVVIEATIIRCRPSIARLSAPRNAAETAMLAFAAAVAAFTGAPAELAVAQAAMLALTSVAGALGGGTLAPAFGAAPSVVWGAAVPRLWSRGDWPATILSRGR